MTHRITLLLGLSMAMIPAVLAQTQVKTIFFDGITREYRLHLPVNYNPANDYPLIFNLHGLGSNGFEQELYSEFSNISDTAGIILVYPEGTQNAWNAGFIIGGVDDVGFISALIDTLAGEYSVDLKRVYSTGMSNGGIMSHYLACHLSDRIAAIASVTGSMLITHPPDCQPGRTVPVLQFHGTDDQVVPYYGGKGFIPVDSMMEFWAVNNGCLSGPDSTDLPDLVAADSSTATYIAYGNCSDSSDVIWYRLNQGGHTWPGAFPLPNQVTNQDIKASTLIWEFFQRFKHPDPRKASSAGLMKDMKEIPNIFYNPVENQFIVRFSQQINAKVKVLNMNGQIIFSQNERWLDECVIGASGWSSGVYVLMIETDQGVFRKKIIKN